MITDKKKVISICAVMVLMLASCGSESSRTTSDAGLPELHVIPYEEGLPTVGDELGADSFDHYLDQEDSKYYVFNDYYNMKSGGSLHIISGFETYQQSEEYTCGPACAVMLTNHYGSSDYSELEIADIMKTDTTTGTDVERMTAFFDKLGWKVESNGQTDYKFGTIEDAEAFFIKEIDEGRPVMVEWEDWEGHWQIVIGIDTCAKSDVTYDDVLIMADPYDVTDHFQDGYYTVPFGRFYSMWREGPCAQKDDPYVQPYVLTYPADNQSHVPHDP